MPEINKLWKEQIQEETVASLTGIPAIVLQFGVGLERATYSNYEEAKEAATEGVVVPLWRYTEDEMNAQLMPDFDKTGKLEAKFNLSEVRVLQDDENKLYARLGAAYRTGFMKRSEARSKAGLAVEPGGVVSVKFMGVSLIPFDECLDTSLNVGWIWN